MLSIGQLVWQNVKNTIKREPVYFLTMILIAALMFAFDSMLFSEDVQRICEQGFIMDVLIGVVTVFIVIITAWLVYYMMCQSLRLRSKEFSLYMLFGVKQRVLFHIYKKETMLMAFIAYGMGVISGMLLKHFLMVIFYHMFRLEYVVEMDFHFQTVILTVVVYFLCYLFALSRIRKRIMKMNIRQFSELERINEGNKKNNRYKAPKTRKWLLKGNRLFIWRTVESEIVSMRKIIAFVSILLMISILGSTVAMMYTDYENRQIDTEYPFDLMIYHESPKINFTNEKEVLTDSVGMKTLHEYVIYQNGNRFMNEWLYTHLDYFGDEIVDKDGKFDKNKLDSADDYNVYYAYDTYMKLSDYNALLQMLGQKQVNLNADEYLLQIKRRLEPELSDAVKNRAIACGSEKLHCKKISTIDFEQNGHNGADYIFVVPDKAAGNMTSYYSVMTVTTQKPVSEAISEQLDAASSGNDGFHYGSNHSILYTSPILAKKEIEVTLKSTVTAVLFPFAYVSLVFLCVAISLLAAHLISTAEVNRSRYILLGKLGKSQTGIDMVIHEQLSIDYLIPLGIALIPGCLVANQVSSQFILDTGLRTPFGKYICLSLLWILMVYLIYFVLTDIFFRRNIHCR